MSPPRAAGGRRQVRVTLVSARDDCHANVRILSLRVLIKNLVIYRKVKWKILYYVEIVYNIIITVICSHRKPGGATELVFL